MKYLPGDIAACFGADRASRLISLATSSFFAPPHLHSGPSHVALLAPYHDSLGWWESTTFAPHKCLIANRKVNGVQVHHIESRIHDYRAGGGRVDIYRLVSINKLQADEVLDLSRWLINDLAGRQIGYDYRGAGISGTRILSRLQWCFTRADVDKLFCSEMVAWLLMRLGRMNRENPAWFHPGRLMRQLVRTGVYERVECFGPIDFINREAA